MSQRRIRMMQKFHASQNTINDKFKQETVAMYMRLRKIQERYSEVLIYVVVVSKVDLSPVGSQLGKNVCHIRLSRTG